MSENKTIIKNLNGHALADQEAREAAAQNAARIGELSKEMENIKGVEPAEDDIPKVFFVGIAPTSKAQDELPLTMEYISKTNRFKNYVTLKVQGDSSANYAKKNFNMKMFSDAERTEKDKRVFKSWAKTNKYTLKANWIDHTHARNVVNGRLWGQLARTRADYADYPVEYIESANCGAVDGFPVKVYLNGVYQGLYTWNIRKDESMFNMDDSTGIHAALIADGGNDITTWNALPEIDGNDWTDELNDEVPVAVKESFRALYTFVMESTDEEFKANIDSYFYLSSLIDYYIFIYSILMFGGTFKSQTMLTYDANKYLANIYDMDTTWALSWDGKSFGDVEMPCPEGYAAAQARYTNRLYERLVHNFAAEIRERYAEVRQNVLSDANIIDEFERFMDAIPPELYAEDYAATTAGGAFVDIPSVDTNNLQKLREVIAARMAYCDVHIPLIGIQEGDEALYPLTNATKTSDGSVITVTNGNHIKLEKTTDSLYGDTVRADLAFPENTQGGGNESSSLNVVWFTVPENATIVYEISNLTVSGEPMNVLTAVRKVGGGTVGGVISIVEGSYVTSQTSTSETVAGETSASYLMLTGVFPTGSAIEFDVSITVDGVRYV